jgi:hypothetical protein
MKLLINSRDMAICKNIADKFELIDYNSFFDILQLKAPVPVT